MHFLTTVSVKMPDFSEELAGSFQHPMTPVLSLVPATWVILNIGSRDIFTRAVPSRVKHQSYFLAFRHGSLVSLI